MAELSPGQKALVMIGLGAILLALLVLSLRHAQRGPEPAGVEVVTPAPPAAPALVAVHVVGAVRQPGVYYVPEHARVAEAVRQAGGLSPEADAGSVNLAAYVQDGEQVKVAFAASSATAAAPAPQVVTTPTAATSAAAPEVSPAAGTPPADAGVRTATHGRKPGPALDLAQLKPVSLSRGTKPELEALPGVGPQLAAAIVTYRTMHGAFRSVDDLVNVPGFGEGRIEALRPYVVP